MTRTVHQSFAAGELAPELHMRSDLAAYQKGAARMRNMTVRRTGSAMKRPGTDALDIGAGFGAGHPLRLFPFYYDSSLSFALLVTATTVRVAQVSPDFKIDRDFSWSGWADADVAAMRVRQAGDTLFCSAPGKAPVRMVRAASDGDWTVLTEQVDSAPSYTLASSKFTFARAGWDSYSADSESKNKYLYYGVWVENAAGQRVKLFDGKRIAVTKVWEAGASVRVSIDRDDIPDAALGHTWILAKKYGGVYGRVGSYEITSEDTAGTDTIVMFEDDNIVPAEQIGRQTYIREGDDAGGYAALDFYQQRQVLAGNASAPWTLWFSRLADLYTWTANRPADDMDPFRATIPAVRASRILHTVAGKRLLVFTSDGVYAVHSGTEGFSARTCRLEKVNPSGCGAAVPLDTGSAVLFTAEDGRTLLEMRYSFADDAHVAVDRSVLSRHLTAAAGVRAMAWQPHPDGILWMLLEDSSLVSFTYLPEHEVFGWSRHGILLPDGSAAALEDIAATGSVLPVGTGTSPRYEATTAVVILARDAAGDPVLLRMRRPGAACGVCADCARTATLAAGASLTVPAGAVWREGSGAWQTAPEAVTVEGPASVEWGAPVQAELETLRPEAPDRAVNALRRRTVSLALRTLDSGRFTVASTSAPDAPQEISGDPGNRDAAHDVKLPPVAGWDWDGRVMIASRGPDKLEALGLVADIEFEGGR